MVAGHRLSDVGSQYNWQGGRVATGDLSPVSDLLWLSDLLRAPPADDAYDPETMTLPSSARELTDDDRQLVDLAKSTIDANTDVEPDEDGIHTMGAAVRSADGQTFTGVNLYHFTGGPCAELVALGAARAAGARKLTTIVAVGNHGRGPVGPCGRDRQIPFDYYPSIRVILLTQYGARSVSITDLMPLAALWTVEGGTQPYDPTIFEEP